MSNNRSRKPSSRKPSSRKPSSRKPLGRKAYGSIGHLPNSRLGPSDHTVPEGQARICTEKLRDKHDEVIVQEKLDGSCTAVALINGEIHSLGRAGWPARSSPYKMHHLFADWVDDNKERFLGVLQEGERVVGEFLGQAHGTIYDLTEVGEPWFAFDIMRGNERLPFRQFRERVFGILRTPHTFHIGGPLSVGAAMELHEQNKYPCEQTEGVVYRVERKGEVDFLAKWVRPDKIDGKYLAQEVWNKWKSE